MPCIMPKHLSRAYTLSDSQIILVQDTADEKERFEAFVVDLKAKRADGVY